jgi:ferric-dicitrate binding protein FerR (iron transport regulator)
MTTPLVRHLETEDLVRLMDEAVESPEQATLEAHIAICPDCGRRSQLVQDWSESLSSVLVTTDRPVALPDSVTLPRRSGWRAAAAIALIIAAALAAPPLRAWMVQAGARVWAAMTPLGATKAPARIATGAPRALTRPGGPDFSILLAPGDTGSTLVVETVSGDSLSVTRTATRPGTSGSRLVMLPDAIQLGGNADYVVQVPLSVRRLFLKRGDAVIRTLRPAAVGERWVLPFQGETAP